MKQEEVYVIMTLKIVFLCTYKRVQLLFQEQLPATVHHDHVWRGYFQFPWTAKLYSSVHLKNYFSLKFIKK